MTALLTDNLPLLAGAPNGIKKLRELILELAVRGKLVPQDPNDEPASELLKRIAQEKARLVAEGKIKKQKALPEVSEDDQFFELPPGWRWCRLQDAFDVRDGTHDTPKYQPSGYPLVTSKNLYTGKLDLTDVKFISEEDHQKISARSKVDRGDILFAMIGSIGNPAIVDTDIPFSIKNVALLKQYAPGQISTAFLLLYLSVAAADMREKSAGGVQSFVSLGSIRLYPFAFPALSEQLRIVAKVDELMALCGRLEAQQADAESAHAQLVQALLGSLTQAADAEDFAASWQRLAEHFHTLFTTESSIDALKQTLLQLAVMGKLVPQDPSDEPASELLKRVAEKKARLISEEGLRTTAREDVPEAEYYFTLHAGWASYRLGNIARFIDYRGRTPTKTPSGVPLITAKNVRPGFISREPQEFIADTDYLSWMTRGFPRVGDMLFTTEAPMGNVAIIDIPDQFALAQRVICFQLHELEIGPFLKLVMMSSGFQAQLSDAATGMTATGIKSSRLKEIPVPVPPLPEQHRIVAKVDQLLTLCDQLKTRLTQARQLNEQLATALVEQAVA